jgi:hypothetical protein
VDWNQSAARMADLRMLREKFWCKIWALAVIGVMLLPTLLYRYPSAGFAAALAFAAACVWTGVDYARDTREEREIERTLMLSRDPMSVGLIFEALINARGRRRIELRESAKQMVPLLMPEHAQWLTRSQRDAMRLVLMQGESVSLSLAILEAYARIGDRPARGLVRTMAYGLQTQTRDPRIQEAAQRVFPIMDARLEVVSPDGFMPDLIGESYSTHAEGMVDTLVLSTLDSAGYVSD